MLLWFFPFFFFSSFSTWGNIFSTASKKPRPATEPTIPHDASASRNRECVTASYLMKTKEVVSFSNDVRSRFFRFSCSISRNDRDLLTEIWLFIFGSNYYQRNPLRSFGKFTCKDTLIYKIYKYVTNNIQHNRQMKQLFNGMVSYFSFILSV